MQSGKSTIRVRLGIDGDIHSGCAKLSHHGVEIVDSEVDHPALILFPEVTGVFRKRTKGGGAGFLDPRFLAVLRWYEIDSQLFLVPPGQCRRIVGAEEKA